MILIKTFIVTLLLHVLVQKTIYSALIAEGQILPFIEVTLGGPPI